MSAIALKERPEPILALDEAPARIVLAGFAEGPAQAIAAAWRERAGEELRCIPSLEAAFRELPRLAREARVVCFGPAAAGHDLARRLDELAAAGASCQFLVLGAGEDPSPFAGLVEEDGLFYLAARPPAPAEVALLLAAAGRPALLETVTPESLAAEADEPPAEVLRAVLEIERCRGLEEVLEAVEQAALKLAPAQRALCRWVDRETWTLWRPGGGQDEEAPRDSAVTGLAGFVARTGHGALVARVGDDPRYDAETDNAGRSPREPFLAVALPAGPGAREPRAAEAVLTLSRGEGQESFGVTERLLVGALVREAGPILRRRRLAAEQARRESHEALYRRQALEHREVANRSRQEPLRLAPAWIGAAYRTVLVLFGLLVLALPFAGTAELALGPAVVRLAERIDLRAAAAGVLARLDTVPGAAVRRGQELGRLASDQEQAELEQLRFELEERLVERLRDPHQAVDPAFASLRERHQLAAARLESRILRAPGDGTISALLARPGQSLAAGQPVLSLAAAGAPAKPSIEVLLPGRFRPLLRPGMELRFRIDGYPDGAQQLLVREVSQEVIGPDQAAALLGAAAATPANGLGEGLVIVRADLPAADFASDGRRFPYFDGMSGQAEVRVRSKRFITDWLRRLEN